MEAYGTHIIAELSECTNIHFYDDMNRLQEMMKECVEQAGLRSLGTHAHKFDPQGISAMVILQESHFSVHIFPEIGYAALDCYTCGKQNEESAHIAAQLF